MLIALDGCLPEVVEIYRYNNRHHGCHGDSPWSGITGVFRDGREVDFELFSLPGKDLFC